MSYGDGFLRRLAGESEVMEMKHIEIERKFLVKSLPDNLASYPSKRFVQGYLSTDPVLRVRREGGEYFVTYKSRGLMEHEEYNLPLTKEAYEHLIQKADGIVIEKMRYFIPDKDGLTIEMDVFGGELDPLILAEVEFDSAGQADAYVPPEWFGREVTDDTAYHNSTMSKKGLPEEERRKRTMKKMGIFMADGCEEIEALTVVDILRRADIEIDMISITGKLQVTGSHGITFTCDRLTSEVDFAAYDGLVLPGGMPGTTSLGAHKTVVEQIKSFAKEGKLVSAICAAPSVLGDNDILQGKKATCHPGFEDRMAGADVVTEPVAADGNVITSRGMGTAIPFALEIVKYLGEAAKADEIREAIVF